MSSVTGCWAGIVSSSVKVPRSASRQDGSPSASIPCEVPERWSLRLRSDQTVRSAACISTDFHRDTDPLLQSCPFLPLCPFFFWVFSFLFSPSFPLFYSLQSYCQVGYLQWLVFLFYSIFKNNACLYYQFWWINPFPPSSLIPVLKVLCVPTSAAAKRFLVHSDADTMRFSHWNIRTFMLVYILYIVC